MDIEKFILDLLNGVVSVDFQLIMRILGVGLLIFWVVVISWVWLDSGERTTDVYKRIAYVLLVVVFNVIGWIIYLIIRPSETIEEIYWSDLERRYLKYETSELGDCPKCGYQLLPGFVFCPNCGFELKRKCSECDVYVDRDYKYCPYCNNKVGYLSKEKPEPTAEIMEQQVQESKEEATEVVESKRTRYSTQKDLVVKIGEKIVSVYKGAISGVSSIFAKKEMVKKEEDKQEKKSSSKSKKKSSKKKNKKKSGKKGKKK